MTSQVLEHKVAIATVPTGVIAALDEGVVEAIVSITNHVDNVGDLILPGAYAESLRTRTPKGLFSHDDKVWVARTEQIEELLPGDPRLAAATSGGKPWPREAGALWVKARFNLATTVGREAFENVKFFGHELEWSIGYRVPSGEAKRGRDGVRRIKRVDLFEYSLVMFGAASQTRTLSVKSTTAWSGHLVEGKADRADAGSGVMVVLMLPGDVAQAVAVPGGVPVKELHITLAYLGQDVDDDTLTLTRDTVRAVAAEAGPLSGTIGGIGAFPPGEDGVPVFATVDVPGLEVLRQRVVDALLGAGVAVSATHGFTPHTTLAYLKPGEPLPAPLLPASVAFDAVTLARGSEHTAYPLGGTATARDGWGGSLTETKSVGLNVARTAGYPVPLSFEEIRDAIRDAVAAQVGGGDGFVTVEATFADVAVVGLHNGAGATVYYRVPWMLTAGGRVSVGGPDPVTVTAAGTPSPEPLAALLEEAAAAVKHSGVDLEIKAGRVLSGANAKRLRGTLASLISVLKAAGIDLPDLDDEEEQTPEGVPPEPATPPDSTAPSALPSEMKGLGLTAEEIATAREIAAFLAGAA